MQTRIEMPEEIWEAAKIRATMERRNLQDVIADALPAHRNIMAKGVRKE